MNNDIANLNLLVALVAVIEHGSLSKAAKSLDTNQSTISTMLGRLKQEVGQELFIRKGRGVVPTSYALDLYNQVQGSVHQLISVFQSFSRFDPKQSSRRFITTAPEHLQWFLLDKFSGLAGGNSLEVYDQPDDDSHLYDMLIQQQYDVMIDIVPPSKPSIASQLLLETEFVVICRQGHPRLTQETLSLEQFLSEEHAVLERKRNDLYSLEQFTQIDLSKRKIAFHSRSLFSNLMITSQMDCIATVPLSMAMHFKDKLNLKVFRPPFEYNKVQNYLIWHKNLTNDPANMWLRSILIEIANRVRIEKSVVA
ncbi:LysR family transcriptional regulator [Vibrio fluminensis]|uniref:LysR family transcriptional regulator n=1 Tax=Vibrio fluminensis TaxID=2783614 RepID=UPI001888C3DC|nr:LysR family transcriptional regulator [Vibrio fluminensis]